MAYIVMANLGRSYTCSHLEVAYIVMAHTLWHIQAIAIWVHRLEVAHIVMACIVMAYIGHNYRFVVSK